MWHCRLESVLSQSPVTIGGTTVCILRQYARDSANHALEGVALLLLTSSRLTAFVDLQQAVAVVRPHGD